MKRTNLSPAAREKRIRELAVMDWRNLPTAQIRQYFEDNYQLEDLTYQTLSAYRETEEYKETWKALKEEWEKEMLRLPQTSELKRKITQGMTLSLHVLIEILAGKAQHKDKISAARLMAQLDGRFLKIGEDGESPREVESVANELISALKKQTVQ
jgi:hypothetical protein